MVTVDTVLTAQFYDLDPMGVVWHGNYARFLEVARCALLDRIGYGYARMRESGFAFPVVDMRLKYIRPIVMGQEFIATATLAEYLNRLKIDYRLRDRAGGAMLTRAHSIQVAVRMDNGELQLESPAALIDRVRVHI